MTVRSRSHGLKWLLVGLLILGGLLTAASLLLDPWLRRKLEEQVTERSAGRYQLHVAELHTSWWRRSVRLRGVRLEPGSAARFRGAGAQWPRATLELKELFITGIGVGALLRHGVLPVERLLLDAPRVHVLALPGAASSKNNKPLYEQLPFQLAGIRVRSLEVRGLEARYGPGRQPLALLRRGDVHARDILLSAAGAADTQRIGYAASLEVRAAGVVAAVQAHRLALAAVRFSSEAHRLTLDSLRVVPARTGGAKGAMQVALVLPHLALTGLQTADLQRRQFRADSLLFERPRITFKPPAVPPPALHKLLAPYFDQVQLAHAVINHGQGRITGNRRSPQVYDVVLSGRNLRIDAVGARDVSRVYYGQAWAGQTGAGAVLLDAPNYRLAYQRMRLATEPGLLQLEEVTLVPTLSPAALNRRKHHQSPHLTVRLPYLRLLGFNYAALANRKTLAVQQVEARHPRIKVAGDGRFALNPEKSVATPDAIGRLPFRVDIRQLRVTDCNMYFTYLSPQSERAGSMSLNRLQGTITNITNDPRRMTNTHPVVARVSGWIQNQCHVRATFWLPLLDPQGRHRVEGMFGAAPITMLNSITQPCRLVGFKSGQIKHVFVQMRADRRHIEGIMRAQYADLQLTFLAKDGGADHKNLLSRVKSKLVNVVVIRDENPRRRGTLKPGYIQSRRDLRLSVFSLWRQGLVSGMLNSIGVPQKMAQTFSEAE
ncbi:hypothetical protein [Hymenobacter crusticola]|uniref:AsmA-like C-terminal domain-containing protein n=1 Tax=Hymenobacter crusticola TaxID=1770526 RepID=A0A243WEG6_9BACT|nr:hypothetical protein [Hymenobacter crusticola]OUJ74086.1 hypothetical protein BXP70_10105 [Hymenobacter crusticola]